jgi:riboflavin synthase alpha subunit
LENLSATRPGDPDIQTIVAELEQQLEALDRLGAHIAAAHVDAAVQQLRVEMARQSVR